MTYSELVALIQSLAIEAGAASFWVGAKSNGINYNSPFPQVEFFNTQPLAIQQNTVQYSIGMAFYGKDAHENGSADTLAIQSDMIQLVQRFAFLLRDSQELELVSRAGGDIIGTQTIRTSAKVGTGMFIDFTITVPLEC